MGRWFKALGDSADRTRREVAYAAFGVIAIGSSNMFNH